jgi:hypothetical protein
VERDSIYTAQQSGSLKKFLSLVVEYQKLRLSQNRPIDPISCRDFSSKPTGKGKMALFFNVKDAEGSVVRSNETSAAATIFLESI